MRANDGNDDRRNHSGESETRRSHATADPRVRQVPPPLPSPASPASPRQQQQSQLQSSAPTAKPETAAAAKQLPYTMQSAPTFLELNDTKAGMTGLDKERINQIILQASRNSPFFRRQEEKQKVLDAQIADLLNRKSKLTKEQIRCAVAQMDVKAASLEFQRRNLSRIIVCIDMDMFYAAVEMRDDPKLANVPLAVGTNAMLTTSNYEARKFGVRAGMAGFIGRKLCPKLVIKAPDFEKYHAASAECMSVIADYEPNYRSASVDEVFFDLTEYTLAKYNESEAENPYHQPLTREDHPFRKEVWQMAAAVVAEVRARIKEKTGLTGSAGIAHNKMIAKVCSDINKPDGQFLLDASDLQTVEQFVSEMKVRKIGGIGQVQEQMLKALGIETCCDMFQSRGLIQLLFKPAHIDFYLRVSLGVASNVVTDGDESERKSLGQETTFKATKDVTQLHKYLSELAAEVANQLKQKDLMGKTITLIIKWADFVSNDRSKSHNFHTSDQQVIRETAESLLQQALKEKDCGIRLLGIRVSRFGVNQVSVGPAAAASDAVSAPSAAKKAKTTKQQTLTHFLERSPQKKQMPVLSNETLGPVSLSSRLQPDHDFVCVYCLKQFRAESLLETHLDQKECTRILTPTTPEHVLSGRVQCPVCSLEIAGLSELNSHLDKCLT